MDSFVWHKMPIQVVHFFAQCSILIVGLDFRVRLYDREPPEGKNKKNGKSKRLFWKRCSIAGF